MKSMFQVIEFGDKSGGGISIVRREWLTPRKNECFWPNEKKISHFNKLLNETSNPPDNWQLCEVSKIFYATDDLLKARQKLKQAENESDICTDPEDVKKRKRRPCSKLLFSSCDDSEDDDTYNQSKLLKSVNKESRLYDLAGLPSPPLIRELDSKLRSFESQSRGTTPTVLPIVPNTPTNGSTLLTLDNQANSSSVSTYESQFFTPSTSSVQINQINSPSSTSGTNIDAIARIIVKLNDRMKNIENMQREILEKLTPVQAENTNLLVPIDVALPCSTVQEVEDLELWLANDDNVSTLKKHLSLVGGKKPANVTRRILERLFTNPLAALYNWTGKNQKLPLKNLAIMKLLPDFVRKNKKMEAVSDDEVHSISSHWFRFTKDREGGREKRRPNANSV